MLDSDTKPLTAEESQVLRECMTRLLGRAEKEAETKRCPRCNELRLATEFRVRYACMPCQRKANNASRERKKKEANANRL